MNQALTVTQFVEVVNATLDALDDVVVEGEVDEFKIIHNKWVTFKLKDDTSSIGCFMTVWQLKVQIEDGMMVRAVGRGKLREKGFFSYVLSSVQPAGEGSLKRAFELLKQKLTEEGIFDSVRKRALPRFPRHVALITSRDAAAYSDFIKVLSGRQGGLTISFIHTQVQGEDAPRQLLEALMLANTELVDLDAIVMVRGGGSLEDLQAFNDEQVVRAVAASRTPIVVGVGHERDVSLAELAADVRASTPSNAAELLVRSREELRGEIAGFEMRLTSALQQARTRQTVAVSRLVGTMRNRVMGTTHQIARRIDVLHGTAHRFRQDILQKLRDLAHFQTVLHHQTQRSVQGRKDSMKQLVRVLESLSPEKTLQRGYSITQTVSGKVIRSAKDTNVGEVLITKLHVGEIRSTVQKN